MKKVACICFLFLCFIYDIHSSNNEHVFIPEIPKIISTGLPDNIVNSMNAQNKKLYVKFNKDLKKHLEISNKILLGTIIGNCHNVSSHKKILDPPKLPNHILYEHHQDFYNAYEKYNNAWQKFGAEVFQKVCKESFWSK